MKDGMIKLAPLNPAIPQDVQALVAKQEAAIKAGTLHPFAGPVVDQDGKTRVPAGRNMSDDELGKMDYYVDGVASKLPKNRPRLITPACRTPVAAPSPSRAAACSSFRLGRRACLQR